MVGCDYISLMAAKQTTWIEEERSKRNDEAARDAESSEDPADFELDAQNESSPLGPEKKGQDSIK